MITPPDKRPKRLTPKQQKQLLSIFDYWGPVFHGYAVLPSWCVRECTRAELDAHWGAMQVELDTTQSELVAAAVTWDFAKAENRAEHAGYLKRQLAAEDREYNEETLVTLSLAARQYAERLKLKLALDMKGAEVVG